MDTPEYSVTNRRGFFRRYRGLVILSALCVLAIAYVQIDTSLEGNFKGPLSILAILLMLIGVAFWVLIFSGLRWTRRLAIVAAGLFALALSVVAVGKLTRREGSYTGAGVPRLVWKWSPRYVAPPIQTVSLTTVAPVMLSSTPDDFPQFLGPHRDNTVPPSGLSHDWSAHPPTQLWRHAVGLGWSGFSVVGRFTYTMEQRGEQECTVCYDATTGNPVWFHGNNVYLHESEGGDGPRATPTFDSGKIYSLGGLGNLDCLDAVSGKVIWSKSLLADPPKDKLRYGQTCSPLVVDNMLIVTGGMTGPALMAFDKETGAPIWQAAGDPPGYDSPTLATIDGVRQLLLVHVKSIEGHDLSDGRSLWKFKWPGFLPKNSQAVAVGSDRVFSSTGYGIGSVLLQVKTAVAPTQPASVASGAITQSVAEIWHTPTMKTEMSNVVVQGNYVFGLDDGWLACQDLGTGKRKWRSEKYGHGQIILAGDVLIVQSEEGYVCLIDAKPEGATELGRFTALTSNLCWNTPALAGHLLFVRNDHEAACFRLP